MPLIVQHQATVSDLKAQIHDAYCLRAMKNGWTAETKERLWSWYQKASQWEGGYSFQGYLDMMIQELVALLDAKEKEQYLARGEQFPFPTRVLVRGLDLEASPAAIPALTSLYVKLGAEHRCGRGRRPARADHREAGEAARSPRRRPRCASCTRQNPASATRSPGRSAAHPAEESLPILVAALDSRDSNTTSLILRGLERFKTVPDGPRGARRADPAWRGAAGRA